MGKTDSVTKDYMRENAVFADAFNYFIYGGRQVIQPECLTPLDTAEIGILYGSDGKGEPVQKYRDALKLLHAMTEKGVAYLILGIENHTNVHYAAPVKNMVYDALQYAKQVEDIARKHREAKDYAGHSSGEYLSGFYKKDKIIPVVTLVISFSPEKWDGPLSLHDMMSVKKPEILRLVQNYKIHLLEPASIGPEELKKFKTSLREVMGFIKYSRDKNKLLELFAADECFKALDRSAALVIKTCTNTPFKMEKEGLEAVNLCKAIKDMQMESWEAGMAQGEKRFACLTKVLIQAERYEDLNRAVADDSYRAKLYRELNITS